MTKRRRDQNAKKACCEQDHNGDRTLFGTMPDVVRSHCDYEAAYHADDEKGRNDHFHVVGYCRYSYPHPDWEDDG